MDWNKIAEAAYHAYGQTTDFKNFQGNPMPKWEELPERIQAAWVAAAQSVGDKVLGNGSNVV